jgi:hypothetical protein
VYGAYSQANRFYDPETNTAKQRYITFVARPQAFAVKVPAFFVSGLPTALAAPLLLVGLDTYTDLLNIGAVCVCGVARDTRVPDAAQALRLWA